MIMDMLKRIKQLLGDDKTRKRKAESNAPSLSSLTKKSRTSFQNFHKGLCNLESEYQPIDHLNIKRRHSELFDAYDDFFKRQEYLSNHVNSNNFNFQNGVSNSYLLDNGVSNNFQRTKQSIGIHSRPSIKSVPSLVRPKLFSRNPIQLPEPSSLSFRNQLQPVYSNQLKFDNIPRLYSLERNPETIMNGQSHSDSNALAFSNFSSAKTYCNPLSLKQCTAADVVDKNITNGRDDEKEAYARFVELFPFFKTRKNYTANKSPRLPDTIDLLSDCDNTKTSTISSCSNNSTIKAVNSLHDRYKRSNFYDDKYLKSVEARYDVIKQSTAELKKYEEEKLTLARKVTEEQEKSLIAKTRDLQIDDTIVLEEKEEVEEVICDFPILNQEQVQKAIEYISGRDTRMVLIEKFSLSISKHDIQTLCWDPLTWLNDEVINFYMELLAERSKQNEKLPKVYSMNTFFLKRLLEVGYSGVRRWTRKVDIFSYDIIPVPVHKGIHWCMAIIDLKQKTIKYYDSMGAPNNVVLKALEDYLQSESLDKKNTQFDTSDWKKENVQNIPQQENGSDCGVFSCMYAEFVTRQRPILFTQQHMQYFRMRMVYEICTGKLLN